MNMASKPQPVENDAADEQTADAPVTGKISVPKDNGDEIVVTAFGERTTFKVTDGKVSYANALQRDQLLGAVPGAKLS